MNSSFIVSRFPQARIILGKSRKETSNRICLRAYVDRVTKRRAAFLVSRFRLRASGGWREYRRDEDAPLLVVYCCIARGVPSPRFLSRGTNDNAAVKQILKRALHRHKKKVNLTCAAVAVKWVIHDFFFWLFGLSFFYGPPVINLLWTRTHWLAVVAIAF